MISLDNRHFFPREFLKAVKGKLKNQNNVKVQARAIVEDDGLAQDGDEF